MSHRHLVSATLAAAACAAAFVAATVSAHGALVGRGGTILSVSPAHPDPSVVSGNSYFVHSVAPGASWTDEVAVVNTNDTVINAWVDSVDGITSVRTGAVYAARTVIATRAGTWVRPHISAVTVAPHTQVIVGFTVRVPIGASAGDHLAGIAFESRQSTNHGGGDAITTVLRSVMAVQVKVPGTAAFQFHLYGATVSAVSTTGTSGLTLDMEDVGGLLGKPQLEIALIGPGGYVRTMSLRLDTMLPGDRITDEILWPDALWAGDYRLSVTEDGSGRHGSAFLITARLAVALRSSTPTPALTVIPILAANSLPAWILVGGVAVGAGLASLAVQLVASARRRSAAHGSGSA